MSSNQEDLVLLERIAAGALAEKNLIEKYYDRIWFYLRKKLDHSAQADEVRQWVVSELLERARAGKIKIQSSFSSFLYGFCWNQRCKFLREIIGDRRVLDHIDAPAPDGNRPLELPADEPSSPFAENELPDAKNVVMKLFRQLEPAEQEVLTDYWFNGITSKEVGKKYGMSDMSVRQLALRVKKMLREQALSAFKKMGHNLDYFNTAKLGGKRKK